MTYFHVFLGILKNLHDVKNVIEICKKLEQFCELHAKRTECLSNGTIYNDIPGNDINKALLHLWGQNKILCCLKFVPLNSEINDREDPIKDF
jgi:predicted GNAT family N-acyltransferase